ncbi:MAG: hypothetical protein RLZZ612_2366 [Pseudomonadota bacterium]|jgi:hypothetical protein
MSCEAFNLVSILNKNSTKPLKKLRKQLTFFMALIFNGIDI